MSEKAVAQSWSELHMSSTNFTLMGIDPVKLQQSVCFMMASILFDVCRYFVRFAHVSLYCSAIFSTLLLFMLIGIHYAHDVLHPCNLPIDSMFV